MGSVLPLFQAYLEQDLTLEQGMELKEMLAADATMRELFVRTCLIDARLDRKLATKRFSRQDTSLSPESNVGLTENSVRRYESSSVVWASRRSRAWQAFYDVASNYITLSLLIAAIVMSIIVLSMGLIVPDWNPSQLVQPETQFVAKVTATHNATWGAASDANFKNIDLLVGERCLLNEGLVEIAYETGAVVLLEGPAEYWIGTTADSQTLAGGELRGNSGNLELGKASIVANTTEAKGFTIYTDRVTVVDLGTEFGVVVAPSGDTQVHVFEGVVESTLHGSSGATPRRRTLQGGEAIQYDASSEDVEFVAAKRSVFSRLRGSDPNLLPRSEPEQVAVAGVITSSASIDLSGTVIKAINFGKTTNQTVSGTTFIAAAPNLTVDGVSNVAFTTTAGVNAPKFGTTPDDEALEEIVHTQIVGSNFDGNKPVSVDVPLENGQYKVQLLFHEGWTDKAGQRVFTVAIEDVVVAASYDTVVAQGGGADHASVLTENVTVTDGRLDIDLSSKTGRNIHPHHNLSALIISRVSGTGAAGQRKLSSDSNQTESVDP